MWNTVKVIQQKASIINTGLIHTYTGQGCYSCPGLKGYPVREFIKLKNHFLFISGGKTPGLSLKSLVFNP